MTFNRRKILQSGVALGALASTAAHAGLGTALMPRALMEATVEAETPLAVASVTSNGVIGLAADIDGVTVDLFAAARSVNMRVASSLEDLASPRQLAAVRELVARVRRTGSKEHFALDMARTERLPLPQQVERFMSASVRTVSFNHAARVAVFI